MGIEAIGAHDFVARQRVPSVAQVAIVLLSAFLIGLSIVVSVRNISALIMVLFVLFALMGWYIIVQLLRSRDQLLITEFQNALFASAMGLHNKFCLIIKRDGSIIYLDRSFQELFPQFGKTGSRSVDALLKHGKVAHMERELIDAAIAKGTYEKIIFTITDSHDVTHKIIMAVEPILRPAGFTMLRGREYVERRSEQLGGAARLTAHSEIINSSSMVLLSHVMESMKMGIYIASPDGNIVYCNPLLEQWLGYNDCEIVACSLTVKDLLPAQREVADLRSADIEGVVEMTRKGGDSINVFLNQRLIKDENSNVIGATAIVHLYHEYDLPAVGSKLSGGKIAAAGKVGVKKKTSV